MLTTTVSLKICDIKYVLNILPTTVSFCVQVCMSFVSSLWNTLPIYPKLFFRTVVGYALLIAMTYKSIYNCFFNWIWSLELMFAHSLDSLDIQFKFDKKFTRKAVNHRVFNVINFGNSIQVKLQVKICFGSRNLSIHRA